MKKLFFIMGCIALSACNKPGKDGEQKNTNTVLWAENVETNLEMIQDSTWEKEFWDKTHRMDKAKIFNSVKNAVLAGKLKAYSFIPENELSLAEFNAMLTSWDSTHQAEDINHPGTFVTAPIKMEMTADDIAQIRFDDKIEFDTVANTVSKKVNSMLFVAYKLADDGMVMGMRPLFIVKFPNGSAAPAEVKK